MQMLVASAGELQCALCKQLLCQRDNGVAAAGDSGNFFKKIILLPADIKGKNYFFRSA
jgi:hypothetical protein